MEREQQKDNSLQTIAIVLLCCGAVKMLHMLGVISVEGESPLHLLSVWSQRLSNQQSWSWCFHFCLSASKLLEKETFV